MAEPIERAFDGLALSSDVFELIKTFEFDLAIAGLPDAEELSIRVRLFRSLTNPKRYRCRLSRLEFWALRPTFQGTPEDDRSDEELDSGWDHMLAGHFDSFEAADWQQALALVTQELRQSIGVEGS
ncbi:MAG: hypothetical protein NXI31_03900 [bacterium]|nr:hypothetical protein [bacterium]